MKAMKSAADDQQKRRRCKGKLMEQLSFVAESSGSSECASGSDCESDCDSEPLEVAESGVSVSQMEEPAAKRQRVALNFSIESIMSSREPAACRSPAARSTSSSGSSAATPVGVALPPAAESNGGNQHQLAAASQLYDLSLAYLSQRQQQQHQHQHQPAGSSAPADTPSPAASSGGESASGRTQTAASKKTTKSSAAKQSAGGQHQQQQQQQHQQSLSTNQLLRQPACTDQRLSSFECQLDNLDLWHRFHPLDTEMIITKQGRRMFPPVRVTFSCPGPQQPAGELLTPTFASAGRTPNPSDRYHVLMDILAYDNKRYRYAYHKSSWQQAGKADPPSPSKLFLHPDGPFTLEQLRRQVISFEKIKLTNNEANKHGYIVLNSMHKYQPRIHLVLWRGKESGQLANAPIQLLDSEPHKTFVFQETIFTAVTAYQNHSITKLKIDSNPFAKGFRDSSRITDFELESMQDLIQDHGQCPFSPPRAPPPGFPHFLFAAAAAQQQQQQQQQQHHHHQHAPFGQPPPPPPPGYSLPPGHPQHRLAAGHQTSTPPDVEPPVSEHHQQQQQSFISLDAAIRNIHQKYLLDQSSKMAPSSPGGHQMAPPVPDQSNAAAQHQHHHLNSSHQTNGPNQRSFCAGGQPAGCERDGKVPTSAVSPLVPVAPVTSAPIWPPQLNQMFGQQQQQQQQHQQYHFEQFIMQQQHQFAAAMAAAAAAAAASGHPHPLQSLFAHMHQQQQQQQQQQQPTAAAAQPQPGHAHLP